MFELHTRSVLTAAILLSCVPALADSPRARWTGPSHEHLEVHATPGARLVLYDERERPIARKTVDQAGIAHLYGQGGVDPMHRILTIDGKRVALSALFPAVELEASLPARATQRIPLTPAIRVVPRYQSKTPPELGRIEGLVQLECGDSTHLLGRVVTDKLGAFQRAKRPIPEAASGDCVLRIEAGGASIDAPITVNSDKRVLVSTDRPIYRPGDTIHIRALTLSGGDGSPLAGMKGRADLVDRQDRPIARRTLTTSDFGLAHHIFDIPDDFQGSRLKVRYQLGTAEGSHEVRIGRFQSCPLVVESSVDRVDGGESLEIAVQVRRLDGGSLVDTPVSVLGLPRGTGHAGGRFRLNTKTDAGGRAILQRAWPKGEFDVYVGAEHVSGATCKATPHIVGDAALSTRGLKLSTAVDGGQLLKGRPARLWIATHAKDGRPVDATYIVASGKQRLTGQTGPSGITSVELMVGSFVNVEARHALGKVKTRLVGSGRGTALVLDQPTVQPGHSISGRWVSGRDASQLVTFELTTSTGHPLDTTVAHAEAGVAKFEMHVPTGVAGPLLVVVREKPGYTRTSRWLFVDDPRDLTVTLTPDRAGYSPGETAQIDVQVRDGNGHPQIAAVGLTAVDEALAQFGLEAPDTERWQARLGAADWAREAFGDASKRVQLAMASANQTGPSLQRTPHETRGRRIREAGRIFHSRLAVRGKAIAKAMTAWYAGGKDRWKRKMMPAHLAKLGKLDQSTVNDPWGRPLDVQLVDACNELMLSSAGVDGLKGTADDLYHRVTFERRRPRGQRCIQRMGLSARGVGAGGSGRAYYSMGGVGRVVTQIRSRFPDTLAVIPALLTDENGHAEWVVELADSLTTWLVQARAVTRDGGLGAASARLPVSRRFAVQFRPPRTLIQGDSVRVPVAVENRDAVARSVRIEARASGSLVGTLNTTVDVPASSTRRLVLPLATRGAGDGTVEIVAQGGAVNDAVRKTVTVLSSGIPVVTTKSGQLRAGSDVNLDFDLRTEPESVDVRLYPTALGAVVEGLDALVAMPSGCFEQTSATTYPNALVLDFLRRTKRSNPALEQRALAFLRAGWKRLMRYEVQGGGFSWFGNGPANTILTAFGLVEFERIGRVMSVDKKVSARTRKWLLAQRQKDGSWVPDAEYLHAEAWSKVQHSSLPVTAYVTWSLAITGSPAKELAPSVKYLIAHHHKATDPYALSLVALALNHAAPDHAATNAVRERLASLAKDGDDGLFFEPQMSTHTYSYGGSAAVETTALAQLALGDTHERLAKRTLEYLLGKRRPGGGWMTTQSTVLSLEGLLDAERRAGEPALGTLLVHDMATTTPTPLTAENADLARRIPLATDAGERRVSLQLKGRGALRYQLATTHRVSVPESGGAENRPLGLTVSANQAVTRIGEPMTMTVTVTAGDRTVRMPTAEVGIPAGFELMPITDNGDFDRVEQVGRRVFFYGQRLESGQTLSASLTLVARRIGKTATGPSRAWPYYQPDEAHWLAPAAFESRGE